VETIESNPLESEVLASLLGRNNRSVKRPGVDFDTSDELYCKRYRPILSKSLDVSPPVLLVHNESVCNTESLRLTSLVYGKALDTESLRLTSLVYGKALDMESIRLTSLVYGKALDTESIRLTSLVYGKALDLESTWPTSLVRGNGLEVS
jgi:hypothetical protein